MMFRRLSILLVGVLWLASGCRTTKSEEEQARLQRELGAKIPLWVDLECSKRGKPKFVEYSVLKMPDEKVGWAMVNLEGDCRIYGTLVNKKIKRPDLCDIRFRSTETFGTGKRCTCRQGRQYLEEGTPTSKRCCKKYPDKVYCREKHTSEPVRETPPAPTEDD
jgi:hypothetical protein